MDVDVVEMGPLVEQAMPDRLAWPWRTRRWVATLEAAHAPAVCPSQVAGRITASAGAWNASIVAEIVTSEAHTNDLAAKPNESLKSDELDELVDTLEPHGTEVRTTRAIETCSVFGRAGRLASGRHRLQFSRTAPEVGFTQRGG